MIKLCVIISFAKIINTEINELIDIELVENWGRCVIHSYITDIYHFIEIGLIWIDEWHKDLKVVSSFFDV